MNYNDKINVLMHCIDERIKLPTDQALVVRESLIDGFIRIVQAEELEQRASKVLYPSDCPVCGRSEL